MRAALYFLIALSAVMPASGQTINGESNYEDGISHIPPQGDEQAKSKSSSDNAARDTRGPRQNPADR